MAKHLVVFGHGAGDPGAVANGTNERDWTRNVLMPVMAKYARLLKSNTVDFYDTSKNMYDETRKGFGAYSVKGYASVTEYHLDSAKPKATGGHVIISSRFDPDGNDLAIAAVIGKYVGWWGSVAGSQGVNKRSNLLNLNVFANRGISYRLPELGFISNSDNLASLNNNIDAIGKEMIEAITGEVLGEASTSSAPSKPSAPKPTTPTIPQIAIDGYWGAKTTKRIQQVLGLVADGILGKKTISAIQRIVGVTVDGIMGPQTIRGMQRYFGTVVDGIISKPSLMVKAMQKQLNQNRF